MSRDTPGAVPRPFERGIPATIAQVLTGSTVRAAAGLHLIERHGDGVYLSRATGEWIMCALINAEPDTLPKITLDQAQEVIPDLDEARVTALAASVTKLLRAEMQDTEHHPDRIYEALNALACVAGVLIESAGPTARAVFDDALRKQTERVRP